MTPPPNAVVQCSSSDGTLRLVTETGGNFDRVLSTEVRRHQLQVFSYRSF
jgi:hypothetical protein